jgi:hypothetical protein
LGTLVVRASLAMVCMMFIAHTISTHSQSFKMGCPAAYVGCAEPAAAVCWDHAGAGAFGVGGVGPDKSIVD